MRFDVFLTLSAIALPLFILGDLLWLGVIARKFYVSRLGDLMGPLQLPAAVAFYVLFVIGLTFFALYPSVMRGTLASAVVLGGLFGFFTYMTYDLTSLSVIRSYPFSLAIVDIAWGTVLCAVISGVAFFIKGLIV